MSQPRVAERWLRIGEDGRTRCWWSGDDPAYVAYHDEEWGRPLIDDRRLFEKLCLEGFQAGLSWLTILRKRERFREVFAGFEPAAVARYGEAEVERLLSDAGIVRHRGKIEAAIHNAARALEVAQEWGSLAAYLWSFEPADPAAERRAGSGGGAARCPIPAVTPTSTRLSRDLKRRGWRFVGPTTVYAFMQACGLVNDHLPGCGWREACEAERAALQPPGAPASLAGAADAR